MNDMKKHKKLRIITISYLLMGLLLSGCGDGTSPGISQGDDKHPAKDKETTSVSTPSANTDVGQTSVTLRDNTPICLVPLADGIHATKNDVAVIDYSHASDGYVCAAYTGSCPKLKLRITGPDSVVYTYDLHHDGYEVFPLSSGNGDYEITIYENISGTSYSTCLYEKISVTLADELTPFLYPNQYVNFHADSETVKMGASLAEGASSDLEVITNIYNYMISNITYDYNKASDPPTGYTTDIDAILNSGTGICLDYAAVMASMLRSQRIPTRLEVGYAKDAYHAWISIYVADVGWLNGIISFNGNTWTLVDPTFGASSSDKTLKKFIGDGSNYITQKMY